ncbi:hypothetical protein BXY64_3342 [Marinifilum flexuosum]|uniref:Uncharacterized protein n=1 Tax=Marinifilum flexuosum TaxID=1117708 RepID=A0A419WSP0_9BACT|nr:hypothetical protein BXY64_3342 [Marinifilum flexuosum]
MILSKPFDFRLIPFKIFIKILVIFIKAFDKFMKRLMILPKPLVI